MKTSTLLILGGLAVLAYVFISKNSTTTAPTTAPSQPASNGSSSLGSLIQTGSSLLTGISGDISGIVGNLEGSTTSIPQNS